MCPLTDPTVSCKIESQGDMLVRMAGVKFRNNGMRARIPREGA